MKFAITIHKSYEIEEKQFENDNKVRNMLINPNKFMRSKDFNQLSNDLKKKRVKTFLNKLTRKDFKSNKEFDAKERVVVNRKDNYGFDNAVFDDEVKIPRHLRKPVKGD